MKLLRRNTTLFQYRKYLGEQEILMDGLHTGDFAPAYSEPVTKRGSISAPSGFVTEQLFGIGTNYTHVLTMDRIDPDIDETGLVDWNGATYEVKAVRPSLNVLVVALKKRITNTESEEEEP